MRVLVTGGLGFVGRNLANALVADGHSVLAADHREPSADDDVPLLQDIELRSGVDVSDPVFWERLPDDIEAVMHQAACTDTTVMDRAFMWKHNVDAFDHLLAWAHAQNARVVYASSAATYGNAPSPQRVGTHEEPLNPYGESKLAMDSVAREQMETAGHTLIGLRYFNVYGPGERHKGHMASMIFKLAQQMKAGERPRIFRDGSQARDQIYIADIVQGNLLALRAGKEKNGIYNLGTGHAVSFNEIVAALNETIGTSLEPAYIENPYSFYQNHTQADIGSTRESLGYAPAFDLKAGITAYHRSGAL